MTATINPDNFDYLASLVHKEAAIVLAKGKEYLAITRLGPLARQQGFPDVDELVAALKADRTGKLRASVIDAMTTNETLWFRDTHPFDTLRDTILPKLIEANRTTRRIDVWCAAASTGQEPYSLAMVMKDMPALTGWTIRIVATDISASALAKARAGKYTQMEVGRGLPAKHMVKYFQRVGIEYQISDELRRMVEFRELNLAGPWGAQGANDLVFIRNVLIYFDQKTKSEILNRAEKALKPGGYLFLGATESVMGIDTKFVREQMGKTTAYRTKP